MRDALDLLLSSALPRFPLAKRAATEPQRTQATRPLAPAPVDSAPPTGASVVAEVRPPERSPRRSIQLTLIGVFAVVLLGSVALWRSATVGEVPAAQEIEGPPMRTAQRLPADTPIAVPTALVSTVEPPAREPAAVVSARARPFRPNKKHGEKAKADPAELMTDDEETFGRRQ